MSETKAAPLDLSDAADFPGGPKALRRWLVFEASDRRVLVTKALFDALTTGDLGVGEDQEQNEWRASLLASARNNDIQIVDR